MYPASKAGLTFSTKCCLLAAAYNKASVRASIIVFFLSKIIFLTCSAISIPPGSRVNNTLYPSDCNFSNIIFEIVVLPLPSGPSNVINLPLIFYFLPFLSKQSIINYNIFHSLIQFIHLLVL